jgi:hypothetical protein
MPDSTGYAERAVIGGKKLEWHGNTSATPQREIVVPWFDTRSRSNNSQTPSPETDHIEMRTRRTTDILKQSIER